MIARTAAASRSVLHDYVALTKPRIISLLLVTTLGAMFLAAGGAPPPTIVLLVLLGGTLAAGGANSLNHALEGDVDERMGRTRNRPVAAGRISPREAMIFGIALNVVSFALLASTVNLLSALLTLSGTVFYVLVYTVALKRSTPHNIVIGGAAGAVPPLVGWAAITGFLELPALYLFAIVFFWTPPHFWALSLLIKDDYARAKIPMLPVVTGVDETKKQIFLYTLVLVALSLMFYTTQAVGLVYMSSALALGIGFIFYTWRLLRLPGIDGAKRAYLFSLAYLMLLFVAVGADSFFAV